MKSNWKTAKYLFFSFLATQLLLLALPAQAQFVDNDLCSTAQVFDEILAEGDSQCIVGNNIGANAELPYINQASCIGGIDFPVPADDVWYQVTAQGNLLDVNISSDLDTLLVALYENVCDSLVGRLCVVTTTGGVTGTFAPVAPGETYFIQVSGGSLNSQDEFEICLTSYDNLEEVCIISQTLEVNPLPDIGTYEPGQEVTFCLNVGGYEQNSADWFHGLVPIFGDAWDVSTLSVTPPESCDGVGYWEWYDEVTGTGGNSVGPQGPGFFYERTSDETPPNPGNNFGDNSNGDNCDWIFCFTISTVAECPPGFNGQDLSIIFNNYSDSESGSWSGNGSPCPNDPNFIFKAVLSCCKAPDFVATPPTCNDPTTGSIMAVVESGTPPYTFEWSTGVTEVADEMSLIENLTIGFYQVTVTDNDDCEIAASFTLDSPNIPAMLVTYQQGATCPEGNGVLVVEATGTIAPYTFTIMDDTGAELEQNQTGSFNGLTFGDFTVEVEDGAGCLNSITTNLPAFALLDIAATSTASTCPSGNGSVTVQGTGGLPSYMYSLDNGAMQSEPLFSDLAAGTYTVQLQDFLGCLIEEVIVVEDEGIMASIAATTGASCAGADGSITVDASGGSGSNYTYSLLNGTPQSDNVLMGLDPGDYTVQVTDEANDCTIEIPASVSALPEDIAVQLNEGTTIVLNNSTDLTATASGSGTTFSYTWSPSATLDCSDCPSVVATPSTTTTYMVEVMDEFSCTATDSVTITVIEETRIVIPNAFSPNNDTNNDVFKVTIDNQQSFAFKVFNRWGEEIFSTTDPEQGWDGTYENQEQDVGIYVYYVEYVDVRGIPQTAKGQVMLVR